MYTKPIGSPQRYLTKKLKRWGEEFWSKYRMWVIGICIACIVVLLIYMISSSVVYSSRYRIAAIEIAHVDSSIAQEERIEQYMQQMIGARNSYLALRFGSQWRRDREMARDTFPLIDTIDVVDFIDNTLFVNIAYHRPRVIRHIPGGERFGSYDEYIYPLAKDYIVSGNEAILYLPSYLQDLESLDGIYHESTEQEITNIYHTVNSKIPLKHMIVYPGAGYVAMMTVDDLKVLFSLRKPIQEQIQRYSDVYTYYEEAHRITQIDVGSLDDVIVTLE